MSDDFTGSDDLELARWRAALSEQPTGRDVTAPGGSHELEPPWSWSTLVGNLAPMSDRVLDLGTGDGEVLASLAEVLPEGTSATESWPPNVPIARARLAPLGIEIHEHNADRPGSRLPFPDGTFDLVLSRLESYDAHDVARVLAPGGSFLAQQVGADDLRELDDAFEIEPAHPDVTLENAVHDLTRAGLTVERSDSFHGTISFDDMASLLGYLRRIPWHGPDDLDVDRHRSELEALAQQLRTGPLTASTSRFLVLARAPSAPDVGRPDFADFADLVSRSDRMPEVPRV